MNNLDLTFQSIEDRIPYMSRSEKLQALILLGKLKDKIRKKPNPTD